MIDLIDVSKSYGPGLPAVNHANLHIDKGEFVFVVGNSGSGNSGNGNTGSGNNNGGNGNTGNGGTSTPETPVEQPTGNGWSQEERNIISAIYVKWANFEYTDDEAQAQLAAQLPGRTCTLVHYPPERNAEAEELWRSLDENVYCVTGKISDDVDGTYFIYGR